MDVHMYCSFQLNFISSACHRITVGPADFCNPNQSTLVPHSSLSVQFVAAFLLVQDVTAFLLACLDIAFLLVRLATAFLSVYSSLSKQLFQPTVAYLSIPLSLACRCILCGKACNLC
jgi:hypothetical protein